MNSCMARPFPPCLPPLMTLKAGVGRMYFCLPVRLVNDWMCQQRGRFLAAAPARATANEIDRIAFAPISFLQQPQLLKVPSNSLTMQLSISTCLVGSLPTRAGDSTEFTLFTALETPIPMYSSLLPSLSSTAQYFPVDAPEGTEARKTPRSVVTSVSMVGLPRESKICLALIFLMEEQQQWSGLARILIIYWLLSYLGSSINLQPRDKSGDMKSWREKRKLVILDRLGRNGSVGRISRAFGEERKGWIRSIHVKQYPFAAIGRVFPIIIQFYLHSFAYGREGTKKTHLCSWQDDAHMCADLSIKKQKTHSRALKSCSAYSCPIYLQPILHSFQKNNPTTNIYPKKTPLPFPHKNSQISSYQQQRWKCFFSLFLSTVLLPPQNPVLIPHLRSAQPSPVSGLGDFDLTLDCYGTSEQKFCLVFRFSAWRWLENLGVRLRADLSWMTSLILRNLESARGNLRMPLSRQEESRVRESKRDACEMDLLWAGF